MPTKVTDPALLDKLKSAGASAASSAANGKKVSDPGLLEKLHGDNYLHPADMGADYLSQGMSGVNEGLADLLSLPAQALTGALSIGPAVVNAFGGHAAYPNYVPDPGKDAMNLMEQVGAIKPQTDDPTKIAVRRIGREIGRSAIPIEGSVLRAAQPLRTLGSELIGVIGSGTGAAAANAIAPGNPMAEMAGQVLGGGVGSLATLGARKAVTPFPTSAERTAAANNMAAEGVGLTAGQRTGSRSLKYAESELGGAAAQGAVEDQAAQFTRAALSRAGINADRATPDVINQAYTDIGHEFDSLVAGTSIRADRQLGQQLHSIQDEFNNLTGDATRPAALENRINDIVAKVQQNGGTIPGDVYKSMRSEIDTLARKSTNPELKGALSDLRTALDDAVERTLAAAGSSQVGAWRDVRGRYRNLVILTDAATRAGEGPALGIITPGNLRGAVAANVGKRAVARGQSDLGELARNGNATMAPLPQSGTVPRLAARGVATGLASAAGAVLGNGVMPGAGAVLGGLAGAAAPAALGRVMLSGPGREYLGNQLMQPRLDVRGVGVASGIAGTAVDANSNRTMSLGEWVRSQQPVNITVNGGAN